VLQIWARADDRLRRNPPPLGRKRDAAGKAVWSICKSRGWRELKVIAALTDSTLDRLLQPVGWVERQRNPSPF
jgi:hypothetical protein